MNIFYVYILFRPWDGTPCYVGKGKGRRWLAHENYGLRHPNERLARILTKAKRLGMEIPKIKLRENLSEAEAFTLEIIFIKAIGRDDQGTGPLVNFTDGGEGTSGLEQSAKDKIRASKLGKPRSIETIEKMRSASRGKIAYNRGKSPSQEAREKMSISHLGKPSLKIGTKISEEQKRKIRLSKLGQRPSEETRAKMSISQRKAWVIRRQDM